MSRIDTLSLESSLDLSGLFDGLDSATAKIDAFLGKSASRLTAIPTGTKDGEGSGGPSGGASAGVDASAIADSFRSALVPLGGQIQAALGSASKPLHQFVSTFAAQFEEVGPIVEETAVRIDAAMRFPVFLKRVESFRKGFRGAFGIAGKEATKELEKGLVGSEASAAKFVASLEPIKTGSERFRQAMAGIFGGLVGDIKSKFDELGNGLGYAIEDAIHVPKTRAFDQLLNSIDGFKTAGVKRMEAALDAVMNAKGKGSRKGRWAARDNAASLAAAHAARPPLDTKTVGNASRQFEGGWKAATAFAKAHVDAFRGALILLTAPIKVAAFATDKFIGAWVGVSKIKNALSSIGSVAGSTFSKLSGIRLPKLNLDTRQSTVLKGVGGAASKATSSFKNLVGTAAAAAGLFSASYVAVDFMKNGIKGASDLNETLSKTDVLLGAGSPKVKAFADDMASKFGLVKGVTLDTASGFAGLGRSLGGLKGDKLADFAIGTTKLAADLSSFANIDVKDAAEAINTTLAGNQSDKLKELGVIVNETTIEQYALAHGIAKTGKEFSEQQKFMIRSALVTKGLAAASGDLERTQGGTANQTRKLFGTIENLGTSIGSALLPAVNAGVGVLNEFASVAYQAFEGNKETITGWVEAAVNGLDWVGAVVTHLPDAFNVARLVILEKLTNIGEYIAVLGPNAVMIAEYIGRNWVELLSDAFSATITGLQNVWTNFQAIGEAIFTWLQDPTQGFQVNWTPLLQGFEATAEKLPELIRPHLTDLSNEIAAAGKSITDDVAARRAKRAVAQPIAARELPDLDASAMAEKEAKKAQGREAKTFAGAAELGTKEFYTGLINHANRANGLEEVAKSGRKTAENTGQLVREMQALRRDMNARPKPVAMNIS